MFEKCGRNNKPWKNRKVFLKSVWSTELLILDFVFGDDDNSDGTNTAWATIILWEIPMMNTTQLNPEINTKQESMLKQFSLFIVKIMYS